MVREPSNVFSHAWSVLALVLVVAGIMLAHGYEYPSSNLAMELPPILSLLDSTLYTRDFFVQEMRGISPRMYYNYLMVTFAEIGFSLTIAYLVLYVAALLSFVLGLRAIARLFRVPEVAVVVFVFWSFSVTAGLIGAGGADLTLWYRSPIPSAFAAGIAVWGIYYALQRHWIPALAFFGAASMLQFLVGMLPVLLLLPFLAWEVIRGRQLRQVGHAVLVFTLAAGTVYVPLVVSGATSSSLLDNAAFVQLYAFVRHPHHHVPSTWPLREWVRLLLFYAGGILCLRQAHALPRSYRRAFITIIGMSLLSLLLNYIFVEIWPLALVAKLQSARTTYFAQFVILLGLGVLLGQLYRESKWIACVVLTVIPVSHHPGLLLVCFGLGLPWIRKMPAVQPSRTYMGIVVLLGLLLYRLPVGYGVAYWINALLEGPLLLGLLFVPYLLKRHVPRPRQRLYALGVSTMVVCAALVMALLGWYPGRLGQLAAEKVTLQGVWRDDIQVLAERFQAKSPRDALVLTPPSVQHFRWAAHRAVVVDQKSFPHTDRGMIEWERRMQAVETCADWHPRCVAAVARRYRASHVLSPRSAMTDAAGPVVDEEGEWVIWQVEEARP